MICDAPAHYLIDGVAMCRRHAGFTVLDMLIDGKRPNVGRLALAVLAIMFDVLELVGHA